MDRTLYVWSVNVFEGVFVWEGSESGSELSRVRRAPSATSMNPGVAETETNLK